MQMTFPVVVETGEDNENTIVNVTMEVELGEGFEAMKSRLRNFLYEAARSVMVHGEIDNWSRRFNSLYYGVPLLSLMRYYDFMKSNDTTDQKIAAIARRHGVVKIEEAMYVFRMANYDDGSDSIMEWDDWCSDCNNWERECECEDDEDEEEFLAQGDDSPFYFYEEDENE